MRGNADRSRRPLVTMSLPQVPRSTGGSLRRRNQKRVRRNYQTYKIPLCARLTKPGRNPRKFPAPKHRKFTKINKNPPPTKHPKNTQIQQKKMAKKKGRLAPKREPGGRSTKTGRTNRETRDKPQWIETQRSLSHVQRPDHN